MSIGLLQSGKCSSGGVHWSPLVWKVSAWFKKHILVVKKSFVCVHGCPLVWRMVSGRGPVDIQTCFLTKTTVSFDKKYFQNSFQLVSHYKG